MHEFNLGETKDDFRVPDGGVHRTRPRGAWHPTAALVVEIVSPDDEIWQKLPFYAAHHVNEALIIDPQEHTTSWLAVTDGEYRPIERSSLIEMGPGELAERIDWLPLD